MIFLKFKYLIYIFCITFFLIVFFNKDNLNVVFSKELSNFKINEDLLITEPSELSTNQKKEIARFFISQQLSLFDDININDEKVKKMDRYFSSDYLSRGHDLAEIKINNARYKNLKFYFSDEKISSKDNIYTYESFVNVYGQDVSKKNERTSTKLAYTIEIGEENNHLVILNIKENTIK